MKIQKMGKRPVASFLLFMTLMVIIFGWMIIFEQHAYASTFGNYTYTTNTDGTVTITGYTGSGGTVTIPSTLNGKTVSAIGANSFAYKSITSVTVPSSVTSIGSSAFISNSLTSVTIPSSLTSIGNYAFANNNLTSLTIPSSVTTIGNYAFDSDPMTSVTFSIPSSVTSIGSYAFAYANLTSISIPGSVTSIGNYAFENNKLSSVSIPSRVKTIGSHAFEHNYLTSLSFSSSSSLTSIGSSAFANNSLASVSIPNSVTSIGASVFASNSLTSVSIPNSVTSIGNDAFYANNLTSLSIPSSITSIGSQAFEYNKLMSLSFLNTSSLTSIGTSAFDQNSLTTVTIPNSVTSIGDGAFAHNSLTQAIIVNPSTTISVNPFSNNSTNITMIGGVPSTTQTFANNNGYTFSPIITLSYSLSKSTVTNGSVTVSVTDTFYGTNSGNSLSQLRWLSGSHTIADFSGGTAGTDILSSKSFSVSANGTYTVYAKDAAGNEAVKEISVTDIAKLSGLSLNQGTVALTLTPTFSSSTTSGYTASVGNSVSSITVTPTVADTGDTVTVDGKSVPSGTASGSISLSVGNNPIPVVVTAQDGTTTKTYTIDVNRAKSSNANLSGLMLSSGSLSSTFASGTTSYTDSVGNSVSSIMVTPTVSDNTATVTVDGKSVKSSSPSGPIPLKVGGNTISIVVTAQDGVTKRTYTLKVSKATPLTVTYNGNGSTGGTVPTDRHIYTIGAQVTVLGNPGNLTKTGYTFSGWNTKADGTGTNYEPGITLPMNASNVTLYAQWRVDPSVSTSTLPNLLEGTSDSQELKGAGGMSPYTFSIAGGSLPNGLRLQPDGSLVGTPQQSGTFNFTVQIKDHAGTTTTTQMSLYVIPTAPTGYLKTTSTKQVVGNSGGKLTAKSNHTTATLVISSGTFTNPLEMNITTGTISQGLVPSGWSLVTAYGVNFDTNDSPTHPLSFTLLNHGITPQSKVYKIVNGKLIPVTATVSQGKAVITFTTDPDFVVLQPKPVPQATKPVTGFPAFPWAAGGLLSTLTGGLALWWQRRKKNLE